MSQAESSSPATADVAVPDRAAAEAAVQAAAVDAAAQQAAASAAASAEQPASGPIDPGFVHLRLRSEYSVLDSIVRLDEVVQAALDDGQPALALSDASNLFGWVKFY